MGSALQGDLMQDEPRLPREKQQVTVVLISRHTATSLFNAGYDTVHGAGLACACATGV